MLKEIPIILISILFIACDFKSSAEYNSEAEALEREGRYEEAIVLLNKALEIDPENIYALLNRAVDKSILGDYEGAINDYSKVIEIDPRNTLALLNRGKNKKRMENYIGAIEDFDRAIKTKGGELVYIDIVENPLLDNGFEFDAQMEEIRFERGISRYNIDSLKTAFEDFDFCIKKNYELPDSYYWRGLIFLAYDMTTEACEDLKKARELGDPEAGELIDTYCK